MLKTLPYIPPAYTMIAQTHLTFTLPSACCPVSKNPQEASTITISFTPKTCVLEIGSFYAYLHSYVGGLKDEHGEVILRDMEGMLMQIAHDCGSVLQTDVTVQAILKLRPFFEMILDVFYQLPQQQTY